MTMTPSPLSWKPLFEIGFQFSHFIMNAGKPEVRNIEVMHPINVVPGWYLCTAGVKEHPEWGTDVREEYILNDLRRYDPELVQELLAQREVA